MQHVITNEEANIIRDVALRVSGCTRVRLEAGIRAHPENTLDEASVNLLLVKEGHDLYDFMSWGALRKGFDLTPAGDAKLDIAITALSGDYNTELMDHVQPIWVGKTLTRIENNGRIAWSAP